MNRKSTVKNKSNAVLPRAADPVPVQTDSRLRGHTEKKTKTPQARVVVTPGTEKKTKTSQARVVVTPGTEKKMKTPQARAVVTPSGREPKPVDVAGRERWNFFKYTHKTSAQQIPPVQVIQKTSMCEFCNTQHELSGCKKRPTHRTIGVQTDYRDSETQTDPYSPDYVIKPGDTPENLTLTHFTWGHGLPAGLREVEFIERARERRAWEATLPPINDPSQRGKRRKMVEERRKKELALREQELESLQEECYTERMQYEQEKMSQNHKSTVQRLNDYFCKLQRQKAERLKKLRDNFLRAMRKLMAKRYTKKGKATRQVNQYCQTYESLCHKSPLPAQQPHVFKNLDTYEGLLDLETNLPSSVFEQQIKAPKPKKVRVSERREAEQLKAMQNQKAQVEKKKPLRFLEKLPRVEKPVPRPPTPEVEAINEEDEEKELAVIFCQKLLRGRSTQVRMLKEREKHLELIQEVCIPPEEEELQKAQKQTMERERELLENWMSEAESPSWRLIGQILDFLPKELVRIEQERTIQALVLKAESERRRREAEESKRRQVEERRRREEDEIFRQVMKVHKATADQFMNDVILRSIDETAEIQASEEMHHRAEELNDISYAMEKTMTPEQSESIVGDIVHGFLIPEVNRIIQHGGTVSQRTRSGRNTALHLGTDSSSSPQTKAATSVLSEAVRVAEAEAVGGAEAEAETEEVQKDQHND